jgi:hypothetical protein
MTNLKNSRLLRRDSAKMEFLERIFKRSNIIEVAVYTLMSASTDYSTSFYLRIAHSIDIF